MFPESATISRVGTSTYPFPLLVSFPQGVPDNVDEMQLNVAQKTGKHSTKTHIVSKINNIEYKGNDYGDQSSKYDGYKYAVGIYNVKSKDMNLLSADHIYVMRPKLDFHEAPARHSTMSYAERKQSLTEEFGSRKKKRALAAAQSNIISAENISGASALETSLTTKSPQVNSDLIKAAEQALQRNKNKRSKR